MYGPLHDAVTMFCKGRAVTPLQQEAVVVVIVVVRVVSRWKGAFPLYDSRVEKVLIVVVTVPWGIAFVIVTVRLSLGGLFGSSSCFHSFYLRRSRVWFDTMLS